MFREWRVCLVLLVLWCGSRDVASGGGLGETARQKYLEIIGTGQRDRGKCGEAPAGWYEKLAGFAGKSADALVKFANETDPEESKHLSERLALAVENALASYDVDHPKGKRCVVTEGLVCSGGKCVKCDKAAKMYETACGLIKTIVDKEGRKSEGGRVKTPVGVVVVSFVIGFVFAL